jgi:hypothetical protein
MFCFIILLSVNSEVERLYTVVFTSTNILKFYRILVTVYLDTVELLTEWIVK